MNISLKIVIILAIMLLGIILAVCVKKITEDDVNYAGPMLDKLLTGIKNKNYYEFLDDASTRMKNDFTEENFNQMITLLNSKLGNYGGRIFSSATITDKNSNMIIVVVYKANYSKNINNVKIIITINDDNIKKRVVALTFKSSNIGKVTF